MTDPIRPSFNPIFGQYVSVEKPEAEQLEGLIAYGLYKIAKREWALGLFDDHQRSPSPDDLSAYARTWTPSQIDGKREQARTILAQYANEVVEAAAPGIEKEALKGSFWRTIGYGVLTNLAYTALLILLVFALKLSGVDVLGLAEKIGKP